MNRIITLLACLTLTGCPTPRESPQDWTQIPPPPGYTDAEVKCFKWGAPLSGYPMIVCVPPPRPLVE